MQILQYTWVRFVYKFCFQILYIMEINKPRNEILAYQNEGYYLISKIGTLTSYYIARLGLNMSPPFTQP